MVSVLEDSVFKVAELLASRTIKTMKILGEGGGKGRNFVLIVCGFCS